MIDKKKIIGERNSFRTIVNSLLLTIGNETYHELYDYKHDEIPRNTVLKVASLSAVNIFSLPLKLIQKSLVAGSWFAVISRSGATCVLILKRRNQSEIKNCTHCSASSFCQPLKICLLKR